MKKQFVITVKQLVLYLFLDQGIAVLLMIPFMFHAIHKGLKGPALQDYLSNSSGALCVMIICCIITIAVFQKKRYVSFKPGRIAHSNYLKAAGFAMLIAWGWEFTEGAALQLVGIDKLFPDEEGHFDMMNKMLSTPLGLIAAGILVPITEEIAFRGILVGGMLRMRLKPWLAILLPALVFGLAHGTYTQFVGTTIFGIICGWLYWRTRSLLPGILVHITNNTTVFCIVAFSNDPTGDIPTKYCLLLLAIFMPLLAIGLSWYNPKIRS